MKKAKQIVFLVMMLSLLMMNAQFTLAASCDTQYSALLNKYKKDYSMCSIDPGTTRCQAAAAGQSTVVKKPINIIMIIDSSGSMNAKIGGKTKIDIAKETASKYVNSLVNNKDVKISILTYGRIGSSLAKDKKRSCAGVEEIYYLGPPNYNAAKKRIDGLKSNGYTPIAGALKRASVTLSKFPGSKYDNQIFLISDGEETCCGNPATTAAALKKSAQGITTHVVGFDVNGTAEKQLKLIATSGGGKYYSAKTAADMNKAIESQKNDIDSYQCQVKQYVGWLGNDLDIENKYYTCNHNLETEKYLVDLQLDVSSNVSASCLKYVQATYAARFESYKKQIRDQYVAAKKKLGTEPKDEDISSSLDDE